MIDGEPLQFKRTPGHHVGDVFDEKSVNKLKISVDYLFKEFIDVQMRENIGIMNKIYHLVK